MTRKLFAFAMVALLACAGGARAQEMVWSPAGEEVLSATDPEAVQVFMEGEPANAYRVLGTLTLTSWHECDDALLKALFKQKAAQVGGDGVVYQGVDVGALSCDLITGEVYEEKIYRATVIKFE